MDKRIIYFIIGFFLITVIASSSISIIVLASKAEPEETEDVSPTYVVVEEDEEIIEEDEIVEEDEIIEEDDVTEEVIQEEVEETPEEDPTENPTEDEDAVEVEPIDEEPPVFGRDNDPLVVYNQLSSDHQALYIELYEAMKNHEDSYVFKSPVDMDTVGFVTECIHMDHPELYWDVVGDSCWYDQITGLATKIDFLYVLSTAEVNANDAILKAEAEDIIYGVSTLASDYEKVLYAYEQLIWRTDYVTGAPHNQTIFSTFVNHQTVCAGYAKAMQYILHEWGISCAYVFGMAGQPGDKESHAWNIIELDGDYYYVDVTWGDPVGVDDPDYISYDYLCRNEEFMSKTHELDIPVVMPACTDDSKNYYAMSGMQYDDYSVDAIKPKLAELKDTDVIQPFVFTNEEDYWEMYNDLQSNKVTDALREATGIADARLQYWCYEAYRLDVQRIS